MTVAGVVVGQVTANASGNASLVLSSEPEGDEQALPANFPTAVAVGNAVSAGTLTGTLATVTRGHRQSSTTTLSASLTDEATGAAGTVTYKMSTDSGETSLKVTVTGAETNATLPVTIGDVSVGEITTDANGAGSLVLSSNPTGDEKALPDNFPTSIAAGTAVGIGAMTGTLGVVNFAIRLRSRATAGDRPSPRSSTNDEALMAALANDSIAGAQHDTDTATGGNSSTGARFNRSKPLRG